MAELKEIWCRYREVVESMEKAILNKGFSLVHVIYPCVTNFSDRALGTRNPMAMFKWIKERTYSLHDKVPEGQMSFKTGVYLDASNTREEFSEKLRQFTHEIQRRAR